MANSLQNRRKKFLNAAEGYLMLDMPDHALTELDQITDPENCLFKESKLRGEALRMKEEYGPALVAFGRAAVEKPNDSSLLLGMSWCYKRLDQLDQAIAATKQAYDVEPGEPIILYNLACYYTLASDKEQALSWLGRALRMDKDLLKLIPDEPDFNNLRNDPDFLFIIETAGQVVE